MHLRNPKGDGRAGYYVAMTGLTPEERFANHKKGVKAAGIVKRCGERLVPKLYAHLNPMTFDEAVEMEQQFAEAYSSTGAGSCTAADVQIDYGRNRPARELRSGAGQDHGRPVEEAARAGEPRSCSLALRRASTPRGRVA